MSERIGVFVCECGPNIKDVLDIEELVRYAEGLEANFGAAIVGGRVGERDSP